MTLGTDQLDEWGRSATGKVCTWNECRRGGKIIKGLCEAHYARQRHGRDMDAPIRTYHASPRESLEARTEWTDGGHLVFLGAEYGSGYGGLMVNGRMAYAHRYAWELANGPIPPGMQVNHKCFRRDCVALAHLELVTGQENTQYRSGPQSNSKSGVRGVINVRIKGRDFWRAVVRRNGRTWTRTFPYTDAGLELADEWAAAKRRELFGKYAGNSRRGSA